MSVSRTLFIPLLSLTINNVRSGTPKPLPMLKSRFSKGFGIWDKARITCKPSVSWNMRAPWLVRLRERRLGVVSNTVADSTGNRAGHDRLAVGGDAELHGCSVA